MSEALWRKLDSMTPPEAVAALRAMKASGWQPRDADDKRFLASINTWLDEMESDLSRPDEARQESDRQICFAPHDVEIGKPIYEAVHMALVANDSRLVTYDVGHGPETAYIRIWDANSGELLNKIGVPLSQEYSQGRISSLSISNGEILAECAPTKHTIEGCRSQVGIWHADWETGQATFERFLEPIAFQPRSGSVGRSSSGKYLAVCSDFYLHVYGSDLTAPIWELKFEESSSEQNRPRYPNRITSISWSPLKDELALTHFHEGKAHLYLIDVESQKVLQKTQIEQDQLVDASAQRGTSFQTVNPQQPIWREYLDYYPRYSILDDWVYSFKHSANGKYLLLTFSKSHVFWDVVTWQPVRAITRVVGIEARLVAAMSDDGLMIALSEKSSYGWPGDFVIGIYNTQNGVQLAELTGDFKSVTSLKFTSDGNALFAATGNGIWKWFAKRDRLEAEFDAEKVSSTPLNEWSIQALDELRCLRRWVPLSQRLWSAFVLKFAEHFRRGDIMLDSSVEDLEIFNKDSTDIVIE